MAKKISKSDIQLTEEEQAEDAARLARLQDPSRCKHFAVGTNVVLNNRRGEVLAVLTCKCPKSNKALKIQWEDGATTIVQPYALNRKGLGHD